jgi:hypothetical protein
MLGVEHLIEHLKRASIIQWAPDLLANISLGLLDSLLRPSVVTMKIKCCEYNFRVYINNIFFVT